MSGLLLFPADEIGDVVEVEAPPTPRPTPRRRLPLTPDDEAARCRALYEVRTGKASLSLFEPEPEVTPEADDADPSAPVGVVDLHAESDGDCLGQHVGCPFLSCRHHLGGPRRITDAATRLDPADDADDEESEPAPREHVLSCALAVVRFFPRGLSPEATASMLGITEGLAQRVERYAIKAAEDAYRREESGGRGGALGQALCDAEEALEWARDLPDLPDEYRVVR